MKKNWDWVSPAGAILVITFLNSESFMIFKKMRIMGTENISASDSLGEGYSFLMAAALVMLVGTVFQDKSIWIKRSIGVLSGLIIVGLFYYSAGALDQVSLDKTPYSRISIGVGMWLVIISCVVVIIKSDEKEKNIFVKALFIILPVFLIAVLIASGKLNNLGIMMEYYTYQEKFYEALFRHINISLAVIMIGILLGVPFGYLAYKSGKWERVVIPFINIVETIPAISLITIIMIPLAIISNAYPFLQKWGISGFGLAAPFVALVFYAIFPIIHNTRAAFQMTKPEYLEIGKSMGMSPRQIFYKVQFPLALPVILAGVRIAIVYTIAGTTLAAFIGGGGLGTFILQNDSIDFVLLGTLPIIIISFIADSILKIIINNLLKKRIIM